MLDDQDWLKLTYPVSRDWQGSAADLVQEVERICLRRLEALWWPDGPVCPDPECGSVDNATEWRNAPRLIGWRCRDCARRFHILQAIPVMAHTHHPVQLWFRAIFLSEEAPKLSSPVLGKRLGLQQKVALALRGKIRQMRVDHPDLIQRIIEDKPDRPALRKTNRTDRVTIQPLAERLKEAGPPIKLPSPFDD